MKKLTLILSIVLFISCKKQGLDNWQVTYPPEVHDQVQLFIDSAPEGLEIKPLRIVFTSNLYNRGKKVNGTAWPNKIVLDTASSAFKYGRYRLVLHELGHFALKRGHTSGNVTRDWYKIEETWGKELADILPDTYLPVSLMNPREVHPNDNLWQYPGIYEYYLEELFN